MEQQVKNNIAKELNEKLAATNAVLKSFPSMTRELYNLKQFLVSLEFKLSNKNNLVFIFNNSEEALQNYEDPTQAAAALNSSLAIIQEKCSMFFNASYNIELHRTLYDSILELIYSFKKAEGYVEHELVN